QSWPQSCRTTCRCYAKSNLVAGVRLLCNTEGNIMVSVAVIFQSISDANRAVARLGAIGVEERNLNLLAPGPIDQETKELGEVPLGTSEQPGMGPALGGLVGGAIGVAGGLSIGSAVASLFIPGVGPVIAAGLA